jgi:phosphoglycolate phosphatase
MVRDTMLLPGAAELLQMLRRRGIRLAVVSTKGRDNLHAIFRRFALEELFSCIVGGENVSAPKPDPEGLLFALKQLDLRPEDALFVGDTVIDAETAWRAGTDFAAVTTGTTEAAAFGTFPCRIIAPDLKTLAYRLETKDLQ